MLHKTFGNFNNTVMEQDCYFRKRCLHAFEYSCIHYIDRNSGI